MGCLRVRESLGGSTEQRMVDFVERTADRGKGKSQILAQAAQGLISALNT